MKEFYKSVVANMGGKTVKKTQARSFAQQQTVKNAIVKGPASLAILLKFIEAHEAREAAREALDADVAIGLSAMRLRRCAGITACAGRAGRPPLAKYRRPEEVRQEPASGRLDDLAPNPAGWTTSTPMTRPLAGLRRRDRGNPCIDRGPKFGALVRIEAAQIVGESLHQPIGRQGSSPFGIVLTDDRERRRVVLRAGYLFGPVDRGLDRFDSATRNPAVLARPARRSYWRRVGQGTQRPV